MIGAHPEMGVSEGEGPELRDGWKRGRDDDRAIHRLGHDATPVTAFATDDRGGGRGAGGAVNRRGPAAACRRRSVRHRTGIRGVTRIVPTTRAAVSSGVEHYEVVGLRAANAAQRLDLSFSRRGTTVVAGTARVRLWLAGWGYASAVRPARAVSPLAVGVTVSYVRAGVREWYANGPAGLEQGFDVLSRPKAGAGRLTLSVGVAGDLRARLSGNGALLTGPGAQLRYGGLAVRDARGRRLPASLGLARGALVISVDDRGAVYPLRVDPWVQQAELAASDGAAGNELGGTMAISSDGSTLVAGAAGANKAYVFTKSGSTWSQAAELTTTGLTASPAVGVPVAVSSNGSTIVVGSPYQTLAGNSEQGAVYVFTKSGSTWSRTAELTASDGAAGDTLGNSVAVSASGLTIAAGAPVHTDQQGAVYVFTNSGSKWSQAAKLTVSSGAANFQEFLGWSVALSADGSTLVSGAPNQTDFFGDYTGAAFVYDKPPTGWASTGGPTASLAGEPDASGEFGRSVAISGKTPPLALPGRGWCTC